MNRQFTRKEFLSLTGKAAAGGLVGGLLLPGCSPSTGVDDPAPIPPPPTPRTSLDIQLLNGDTEEHSPGYMIFDGERVYSSEGRFELDLKGDNTFTIVTGLSEGDDPQSYQRTFILNPANLEAQERVEVPHHDWILRDMDGNQVGELSRDGYDLEGPMDVTRYVGHMREAHFYLSGTNTDGVTANNDGQLLRWTGSENGFGPERIIFADVANMASGNEYSFDEPELLFETYKEQFERLIQPLYPYDLPFERVDFFDYTGLQSVENQVLIWPNPKTEALANVYQIYDLPETFGALIGIAVPLPDKETGPVNYQRVLDFVFFHEIAAGYNVAGGRPTVNTRRNESILQQGNDMPVPESLPILDVKASVLIHNQLYKAGDRIDDLLGLPDGFIDPQYDRRLLKEQPQLTYSEEVGGFIK